MYADHDHRGEYADPQHDHDDRYAGDRHQHYGTEREIDRLTGALREASAQTGLLRREHDAEIRQLWERVRQLETALRPQPQTASGGSWNEHAEIPGESDASERDDWDAANWDAAALLPTGKTMNPARPEDATYYDKRQVAYIVTGPGRTGLIRVLTSFGELNGWTLDSEHEIRHDQTARDLGRYRVTGIRNYTTGQQAGEIPDRPVRHWVFK